MKEMYVTFEHTHRESLTRIRGNLKSKNFPLSLRAKEHKARARYGQMWKRARDNRLKVESCKVTPPQKAKAKLKVYIQASTAILEEIKALISQLNCSR